MVKCLGHLLESLGMGSSLSVRVALLNWQEVSLVLLGSHFSTIQREPAHE